MYQEDKEDKDKVKSLEEVGLYKGKYKGWMETFTGKRVNPLCLKEDDVCIIDIAHSLSLTCRYSGHCKLFYSVAEHSVRVSRIVGEELALAALLHDAAEAYFGDVIRPLKFKFPDMVEAEKNALYVIFERYGIMLYTTEVRAIKEADNILIATEARDLMSHGELWDNLPEPLPDKVLPYKTPKIAEESFLYSFNAYGGKE